MFHEENIDKEIVYYWEQQAANNIDWFKKWDRTLECNFQNLDINWFSGGELNVCYNCVDRHLKKHKNKTAIIWQGNEPHESQSLTFNELHIEVSKFANVLKKYGIKKGDRICIYMPMIPEAIIAMLACARIGAIHSVVFAGFSAEALKTRIIDADCAMLITADHTIRGTKFINLKENANDAVKDCPRIKHVIVVKNTNIPDQSQPSFANSNLYVDYDEEMAKANINCPVEPMLATDPLFILYTSGSTGKPKGVLHNCGGYIVYVTTTFKQIFAYDNQDVFWCSADIGWITGHSYLVYGPLANAATTLMYDGVPNYPTHSRYWEIIDKYKVNQFYTSPTALRALRKEGDDFLNSTNRDSLKVLGVVGEPLNPDVWDWFYKIVGKEKCPIVNTWWQTETGGIMLSHLPNKNNKDASVGKPLPGISIDIVNDDGLSIKNSHKVGKLVITHPWPGLMHTVYKDHQRFIDTYFSEIKGYYYSGDGAYCDINNNFWINGRNDDVMNISGHRIGTEEIESAFLTHHAVAEAGVVSIPHAIKGEAIYAFITLKIKTQPTETLKHELVSHIRSKVGPFAAPDVIHWAEGLPKTRSGKIMRRILRKIANKDYENIGDISTLADPSVIQNLIENAL